MEYDQRYNQAVGYLLDLYIDNHITDSVTAEQFKELFDMFIDSRKDIDIILHGSDPVIQLPNGEFINKNDNSLESRRIAQDICDHIRDVLSNM